MPLTAVVVDGGAFPKTLVELGVAPNVFPGDLAAAAAAPGAVEFGNGFGAFPGATVAP